MSRIESEIANELNLEIGDIVIVIKKDGNIKNVVMPEMNLEMQNSISYQKLLKVLDVLKPEQVKNLKIIIKGKCTHGSIMDFISYCL